MLYLMLGMMLKSNVTKPASPSSFGCTVASGQMISAEDAIGTRGFLNLKGVRSIALDHSLSFVSLQREDCNGTNALGIRSNQHDR